MRGLFRRYQWVLVLVGTCAAAWSVQQWRVRRAQRATGAAALAQDTTRAHFDTTHVAVLSTKDSTRLLGDSLRASQRAIVQVRQERDALDKALGLERVALLQLTAQVRELAATVASRQPVREDSTTGTRSAHFDVRSEPYTVSADVTLPRPPASGNMAVRVNVDAATLTVRPGCGPANAQGIRPATATVTGPVWLPITLGRVEQDPELCRSPALQTTNGAWWARLGRRLQPHVSAGYGITFAGGQVYAGPQLGAQVDLWRPF